MENSPSDINATPLRELPPKPETTDFKQKALSLYSKYELTDGVCNIDQVIEQAKQFVEIYNVPRELLQDEVSFGLILGFAQKITTSIDPIYRRRIEGLALRLIQPSVAPVAVDTKELWGLDSDLGSPPKEVAEKFIADNFDQQATDQFRARYDEEIKRCNEHWKARGYDLEIQPSILGSSIGSFIMTMKSGGFVNIPSLHELPPKGSKVTIQIVLPKDYAEQENKIRHELYHIEDHGNYFRRGFQEGIFETLDELHTEYAVGNYLDDDKGDIKARSNYFTAKQFWNMVSCAGEVDFNLLADRKACLETLTKSFGFDGLVDFTLMAAHGGGKWSSFETYYKDEETPAMIMLITREKMLLRKAKNKTNLPDLDWDGTLDGVNLLIKHMTPDGIASNRYRKITEFIPAKEKVMISASVQNKDGTFYVPIDQARTCITAYAKAVAFLDIAKEEGIPLDNDRVAKVIDVLEKVPFKRGERNGDVKAVVEKQFRLSRPYRNSDEECWKDTYQYLLYQLRDDLGSIDFVFGINNPTVRNQMISAYTRQLDDIAEFTILPENIVYAPDLVEGIYHCYMPFELRVLTEEYLSGRYPELKKLIDERKEKFDPRKILSHSF